MALKKAVVVPEEIQAIQHKQTRQAHETELAEDYVELIAELIVTTGEARGIDIAKRLGVAQVTVTKTVERLARDGFVETKPYRSIFLTDKGKTLAKKCQDRHDVVLQFLKSIGVPDEIAMIDAEGIEHHVSDETLAAFKKVIR